MYVAGLGARRCDRWAPDRSQNASTNLLRAFDGPERAGALHRAIQRLRQRAIQNVIYQRGFSGSGHSRHHGEQSERQFQIHIFQIICFGAQNANPFVSGRAALGRHGNLQLAAQVAPGQRIGAALDFLGAAFGHQVPASVAGPWSQIHHIVSAANSFFVVLDDQHGVAEIAQFFERRNQAVVIARVQTDGRLVQHAKHSAQPANRSAWPRRMRCASPPG